MRSATFLLFAFFACIPLATAQTLPTTAPMLQSIPDTAAQTKARGMIHSVFKADFAKTAPADRQALAQRLVTEAASTKDDPSARYVLLIDAADLASSAGDADTAIQAIAQLGRFYIVDALDLQRTALLHAAANAVTPEANESLARHCLDTADTAALADNFEIVQQLANLAEGAANKSRKVPFVASIQSRLADLRNLTAEFAQIQTSLTLLQKTPNDPQSHLIIGLFYALHKGQWTLGLPHLAAGSDATLSALAIRELAAPTDGLEQAALGDAWWQVADKSAGPTQTHARDHARDWYARAQKSLTGITLTRIQARLKNAPGADQSTAPSSKNAIRLLPLIDPAKDSAEGSWKIDHNALLVADGKYSALQLPYFLPDEYDLRITFTRTEGSGPIAALLAAHNKAFDFELDLKGEARFERVANKIAKDNPTTVPVAISNNRQYTLTLQIRNDAIAALLDGKLLTQYKTDYKDLSRYNLWKIPNEKLCGLGANNAKVLFHTIELIEITGTGKPTR